MESRFKREDREAASRFPWKHLITTWMAPRARARSRRRTRGGEPGLRTQWSCTDDDAITAGSNARNERNGQAGVYGEKNANDGWRRPGDRQSGAAGMVFYGGRRTLRSDAVETRPLYAPAECCVRFAVTRACSGSRWTPCVALGGSQIKFAAYAACVLRGVANDWRI